MTTHPERPAGEMAIVHLDGCGCHECAPPDPAIAAPWRDDTPTLYTGGAEHAPESQR